MCYYDGILVPEQHARLLDPAYMAHFGDGFEIDAIETETPGRWVNSAKNEPSKNNLKWKKTKLKHPTHEAYKPIKHYIYFETSKNVQKGQEFFVSYGSGYWNAHKAWKKNAGPPKHVLQEALKYVQQNIRNKKADTETVI